MSPESIIPISPDEVAELKKKLIPDAVIESFNEAIARNFRNGYATVLQNDVVELMKSKGIDIPEAFDKGWLDVEPIYMQAGWEVEYDKPGYDETYEASFKFRKPRNNS